MKLVCRTAAAISKSASAARWSPNTPCAIRARSILPRRSAAMVSISLWAAVSSRSMAQASTLAAPRVSRSWATAVSRSLFLATSMKRLFCAASRRMVAMAMLEVAPNTSTVDGKPGSRLAKAGYPLPEAGAERGIDVGCPLLPLGIELFEVGRTHARIFRWIHAAAEIGGNGGQPVQQGEAHLPPNRKIHGQGDTGHGKRHHPGRSYISEDLDHGKKRTQPGRGNRFQ